MQDLCTAQVLQFLIIIHLLLWISDIFFRRDAEKDGCQNIHTSETASTNQYSPFLSSELDIFT